MKLICVDVKMKMSRYADVKHTPTIRRTLRSDALGKNMSLCFQNRRIATQILEKHRKSAKGTGKGTGRELGRTNGTGKTHAIPSPWTQGTGKTQDFPLRHREVGNREKRERPTHTAFTFKKTISAAFWNKLRTKE